MSGIGMSRCFLAILMVGAATLCAGCSMPPLDDAQLGVVRLATSDDLDRYAQADESRARQSFGSATVREKDGDVLTFAQGDFDEYQEYLSKERGLKRRFGLGVPSHWPILRVSFRTEQEIVKTDGWGLSGLVYYCDAEDPLESGFFGSANVMWHGRFVAGHSAPEIEAAREATSQIPEYEIMFPYTNIEEQRPLARGAKSVTLAPLTSDLCFSLVEYGMFMPPSRGLPLRIGRDALTAALGPLPRSVQLEGR